MLVGAVNLWIAWRYSRLPLGQDEGLWMLWGWTGAVPYRDHVDCKPPGIHCWLWLLGRITGRNIGLTRFLHYVAVGCAAVAVTLAADSLAAGLLFTILALSSFLDAHHAWVEQLGAVFLVAALLSSDPIAPLFLLLAIAFDLKLVPSALVITLLNQWWTGAGFAIVILTGTLILCRVLAPRTLSAVWYSLVTVPRRMVQERKRRGGTVFPAWTRYFSTPLLLVGPSVVVGLSSRPSVSLWLAVLAYLIVNSVGRIWRPYHWIPFAAFCAASEPGPLVAVAALAIGEWAVAGAYFPDPEQARSQSVARAMNAARVVGLRLREQPGSLWVVGEFTQIYVYARKRPVRKAVDQVEIRDVVPERRILDDEFSEPPDLVVLTPGSLRAVSPRFDVLFEVDDFIALLRKTQPPALNGSVLSSAH